MKKIILVGMGGHAKSVVDTIERNQEYQIVGFLDRDDKQLSCYKSYRWIGTDEDARKFFLDGIGYAFITIGYIGDRNNRSDIYEHLKAIGFKIPNVIDCSAALATDVKLSEGIFVGKNAVVNSQVNIGTMSIINSGAMVEHETVIGNFSHIGVGSAVCGNCVIGDFVMIGANSTILQNRTVGSNALVGAGSVVINNIPDNVVAYGNPCIVRREK